MKKGVFLFAFLLLSGFRWGFFAHKHINQLAVFTVPPPLGGFYKAHIQYLMENAVNPDMRRYAVENEAPRHYIDLDVYPDSLYGFLQNNWTTVVDKIGEDSLQAFGIVPWHINTMYHRLKNAFLEKDPVRILKLSAEIGHYIADANVPLHTTENYNGQLTNQKGIHGLWESKLPELFYEDYNFFVGKAEYIEDPLKEAWKAVMAAHASLDSVLLFEAELTIKFPEDKKFSFLEKGNSLTKTYSREFCKAYHNTLSGMVERRMRAAVRMIGDFWYSAWIHAGQPDLSEFENYAFSDLEKDQQKKEKAGWQKRIFKARDEND